MNPPLPIFWIPEPAVNGLFVTGALLLLLGKAGGPVLKGLAVWLAIAVLTAAILVVAFFEARFAPAADGNFNTHKG